MIRVFLAGLLLIFSAQGGVSEQFRMAVTTSFHNSGLSELLLPKIKSDTGIDVQLLVVGTGQALRLAKAGDVDAILVHSRAAEEAFVQQGYASHRREIMYNDFVLVGPSDDPAGVANVTTANAGLTAIALTRMDFISRGDDSGTHKTETGLWADAGLDPDGFGAWYKSVGAGMGAALNTASALGAYVLTDRASWLNFGNRGDLELLFSGDPALFNQYAYLPVSAERHPHVRATRAARVEDWLTSPASQKMIDGYTIAGQKLFVFNAQP